MSESTLTSLDSSLGCLFIGVLFALMYVYARVYWKLTDSNISCQVCMAVPLPRLSIIYTTILVIDIG